MLSRVIEKVHDIQIKLVYLLLSNREILIEIQSENIVKPI